MSFFKKLGSFEISQQSNDKIAVCLVIVYNMTVLLLALRVNVTELRIENNSYFESKTL